MEIFIFIVIAAIILFVVCPIIGVVWTVKNSNNANRQILQANIQKIQEAEQKADELLKKANELKEKQQKEKELQEIIIKFMDYIWDFIKSSEERSRFEDYDIIKYIKDSGVKFNQSEIINFKSGKRILKLDELEEFKKLNNSVNSEMFDNKYRETWKVIYEHESEM